MSPKAMSSPFGSAAWFGRVSEIDIGKTGKVIGGTAYQRRFQRHRKSHSCERKDLVPARYRGEQPDYKSGCGGPIAVQGKSNFGENLSVRYGQASVSSRRFEAEAASFAPTLHTCFVFDFSTHESRQKSDVEAANLVKFLRQIMIDAILALDPRQLVIAL